MDWLKENEYIAAWICAVAAIASLVPWRKIVARPKRTEGSKSDKKRRNHKIFVWAIWVIEFALLFTPGKDPKATYVALFMVIIIPTIEFLDWKFKSPPPGTGRQGPSSGTA